MTRRLFSAAAAVLLVASCSGSTPEPAAPPLTVTTTPAPPTTTATVVPDSTSADPDPAPTTTVVAQATAVGASLRYTPDRDGFSFENFGGGEAPAELTVNMARRFYGDEQVCSSVVDNQCTPYPVILQLIQQANRSMRGGLCEGLTVLSLRLANDPDTLASFQNVEAVASLVKADPALLSEIAYWYVTQFATEVQEQASAFLELSPLALARILYEDFAAAEIGEPSVGYTVGIYSEHGGHAVTPYKVTTDGDRWRVYIYDSNWPTSERWIDVDEDGWTYALAATNPTEASEAWGGGVGTMELTPMTSRVGPFTCGFCPTEDEEAGTMLTVAASGDKQMSIQVETEDGDRLGYYDGAFVNEIEGATYRYLISGTSTADPVLVFLPPGTDNFSADVDVISVPAPVDGGALPGPEPEEDTIQAFSLLILDEERSVQIEAEIPTEPEPELVEPGETAPEPDRATTSLIQFSDEAVEIADIEEATVAIAVDSLAVEIEINNGQQVAVQFAPEPPPVDDPAAPVEQQPAPVMLAIAIADSTGEVIAEVEVDLTPYRVVEPLPEPEPVEPGVPEPTIPSQPAPAAPVVVTITLDEGTGTIEQEEEIVEAWVASDAEYFQAVAEDRVEEVLGESYVDEIEERNEWEPPPEFDDGPGLAETLMVEDDYWEDEQWDEVSYDAEWFEEQAEAVAETFAAVEEEEWWDDEPEVWVEEFVDDWDETEFVNWAAEEEQHILDEMGLTEWNDELMGPPPTETVGWEEEDWIAFDEEMDAIWEERMADPEVWEETILDDLGVEEWNPEWGPSPTESANWEDEQWDAFDEQWAADEEAQILADEGLDEWPEDWGPSPTESALWVEADWIAYDAEQEALWEEEESWELDTDEEWDEWREEFWPEDAEWCDECEEGPWDDPNWDEPQNDPDWSGADEEAWILEQEGFTEWPEDWGPSPSESWEWTEDEWLAFDEEQEALREEEREDDDDDWGEGTEEAPSEDALLQDGLEVWPGWDNEEWSGADEEAWILEQEGFDEWPEDWGPSPTESWGWTEDEWLAFDAEQEEETDVEEAEEASSSEDDGEPGDTEEEPATETDPDPDPEASPGGDPRADGGTWTGADEEAWILEEEGLDAWPEDWGPTPSESWDWSESDWQAYDEEHRPPEPEPEPEPEPSVEVHPGEGVDPHTVEGWSGDDEEGWILEQEGLTEWPADWGPSPSESWDWEPEEWQAYDEEHGVPPPPEPELEPAGWDDPYAGCRGTAACENAPGGFTTWAAYDQANDPAYFDDWGAVPIGFVGWVDYTDAVESGEVDAEEAGEVLPAGVQEAYIPVVVPVAVYYPTTTYTNTNTALSETISTSSSTAQTGTATTTAESGILTHNSNDGHWHLDTTTATTVTTTFVDTTTVVARTGSDMTTCTLSDGVQQGCTTVRGWSPETTTVTAGDPYTSASTTSAVVNTEEGCAEGGWRGMGDWCIVQSSSRQDRDHIQFSLTEVTSVRIDAETNLTRAQFDTSNEAADPYLYLREDTDSDEGDHSGDIDSIAPGGTIETDDDGGRDCGSTCTNPPSSAVDVDETPTITYCNTGGACSNGVPVIDNVSDQWDARIVRTDMAVGDYVVQASVYNPTNSGWYRLTIEEDD